MKIIITISLISLLLIFNACSKKDSTPSATVPKLTTIAAGAITQTTAQSGGIIDTDGGAAVTVSGVCWSTLSTPTILDSTTSDGTGTGSFASSITGLTANTTYYVRAYATNKSGTAYGSVVSFTTLTQTQPISIVGSWSLSTLHAIEVDSTTAPYTRMTTDSTFIPGADILQFKTDGTYVATEYTSGTPVIDDAGTYSISNNILTIISTMGSGMGNFTYSISNNALTIIENDNVPGVSSFATTEVYTRQ